MKRLAVIPARGGSKRIPKKNIRDFCGQPMITYVLAAARDSGLFEKVHVSTESESIWNVAAQHGYRPDFARPIELADDHTPIMPVLRYVTEQYERQGQRFDEIWLLMACAPFIQPSDLSKAASLFGLHAQQKPVLAVTEYPAPIEWAFKKSTSNRLIPLQPGSFSIRSQDLEKHYYDTGSFCVFPPSRVLGSSGAGSDDGFVGYVMPKFSCIDIDDEEDWVLAESMFRARFK